MNQYLYEIEPEEDEPDKYYDERDDDDLPDFILEEAAYDRCG